MVPDSRARAIPGDVIVRKSLRATGLHWRPAAFALVIDQMRRGGFALRPSPLCWLVVWFSDARTPWDPVYAHMAINIVLAGAGAPASIDGVTGLPSRPGAPPVVD